MSSYYTYDMSEDCIFCKIVSGEAPATIVMDNESVIAFENINPVADTHILIVPKKHIQTFMTLPTDEEVLLDMTEAAQTLVEKQGIENGYKLIFNGGRYQAIPHIHWHLLGGEMKTAALQET